VPTPQKKLAPHRVHWPAIVVALMAAWFVQGLLARREAPREVPYSELVAMVRDGKVATAVLETDAVQVTLKSTEPERPGERVRATRLPGVEDPQLVEALRKAEVRTSGKIERAGWATTLFATWILPTALFYGAWVWISRRRGLGAGGGPLGFGRSGARLYEETHAEPVTFADVAGVDDALGELREVVEFLRQPERYRDLGAHVPKGVLLVGPPGTGKTLLARAVAGEAKVPFLSITGSEFVEMFVGIGAARVRDLFERAKERTPCIIFIDELDAVGRSRGGLGVMATHDEREQTLNQLLAEIDGFDPARGIVLMAATNRPEVLDPALLRAGRFDRRVLVDRPDLRGRLAILAVHARKVVVAPDVDLSPIARRTAGMVGADLAGVVNEAALAAARRGAKLVERVDFEDALDRIQLGARKKGRIMTDEEKRRVAVHEAGHALVALSVKHADPVHRVTILPRASGALGATLQLPERDRYLYTRSELLDRMCVLLGGRSAEALTLDEVSSGAADDLQHATELARQMVCRFGMSARLGDQAIEPATLRFLETPTENGERSDETARIIDQEIRALLAGERERAESVLRSRRAALERLAARLIIDETIEREALMQIVGEDHDQAAPPVPVPELRGAAAPPG
jgi:cell division protease FtsH